MGRHGRLWAMTVMLSGCVAASETVPDQVRAPIEALLAEAGLSPDRAFASPDFVSRAAFSSPAAADWVIDYNEAQGAYCGARGCPLQVWVKMADGAYRLVFDQSVLGWRAERDAAGRAVLSVRFHGALCGRTAIENCAYLFRWAGGDGRFMPQAVGADAWGDRPLVQPIHLRPDEASAPAANAIRAVEAKS